MLRTASRILEIIADGMMTFIYKNMRKLERWVDWLLLFFMCAFALLIINIHKLPMLPLRLIAAMIIELMGMALLAGYALIHLADWRRRFIVNQMESLNKIRMLSWQSFEALVGAVYSHQGYTVEIRGGDQPDDGIDLILVKNGERKIVQCKHYTWKDVGVKIVRQLYGTLMHEGAQGAILVTSGNFTEKAEEFAKGKPIELVDGTSLYKMIEEIKDNPATQSSDPVLDYFEKLSDKFIAPMNGNIPVCKHCGAELVPRFNKSDNKWFWGCSKFKITECKGNRSLNAAESKLVEEALSPKSAANQTSLSNR